MDIGVLLATNPVYDAHTFQSQTCSWFSDGNVKCKGKIDHRDPIPRTTFVLTPIVGLSKTVDSVQMSLQGYMLVGQSSRRTPLGIQALLVLRPNKPTS